MYRFNWTPMAPIIPEGKQGVAEIKHISISESEARLDSLRSAIKGVGHHAVEAGSFCQLLVNGGVMMSDTRHEQRSNLGLIWNAKGHVLVAGLGIGMVIVPLLASPDVTRVTVIEKHDDVRALVEAPLREYLGKDSERLEVVTSDVFEYKAPKGVKYDTIYFDIWPDICTDNLDEMSTLHRKFARRKSSKAAYMDSWMKGELQYRRQQERRSPWGW
jgi:hypothetical protein